MEFSFHFKLSDAITSGAGWGALGAVAGLIATLGPWLPFIMIMAAVGKADLSKRRLVGFALLYGSVGALIGGIVAYEGGVWWICALVTFGLALIPYIASRLKDQRDKRRRRR
ncbi:MAG TPA: hypothetical protein VLF67_01855 [Candidatus Saccharimonas sp.]|nr:hypothetical protein [Candidatus Saccharimonas sp.]